MQVQMEQQGALEATIEVRLTKDEVESEVNKALKNYQRKVAMPGFRPGKVPFGMVRKMYGSTVTAEQINKKVSDAINNYLEENKIQFLGYPVADYGRTGQIDFDAQSEYNFYFMLGLKPVLDFDLGKMNMEYAKVIVDEAEVSKTIERMLADYPKKVQADLVSDNDTLHLKAVEADENGRELEGGKEIGFLVDLSADEHKPLLKVFEGRPAGDEFVVTFTDHIPEKQAFILLRLSAGEDHLASRPYNVVIDEILHTEPSQLDEEFFERMFPGQGLTTEEAFRARVAEEIQKHFDSQADYFLYVQVLRHLLTEENIPLPDNFLKRWMIENARDNEAKADIENNYDQYKRSFRYQLLAEHLQHDHPELRVSADEVRNYAFTQYYGPYLAQLGSNEAFMRRLMEDVDNMLKKSGEGERFHNQLEEQKLIRFFREKVSVVEKPMTIEAFRDYAKSFETITNELTNG